MQDPIIIDVELVTNMTPSIRYNTTAQYTHVILSACKQLYI